MRTYEKNDYISDCGRYITTPELSFDDHFYLMLPLNIAPVFLITVVYLFFC